MAKEINYKQIFAKKEKIKQEWLKICPTLNDESGIYVLTREDNGIKYGYVGQSLNILTRLISHSEGFVQHIDRSLKSHKLFSKDNPTGWKVKYKNFPPEQLDEMEQYYVKQYANAGFQLRNKTAGSQGKGKIGINDNAQGKGYREGIVQGKKILAKELLHIIETHLVITLKKDTKISQKALQKFYKLLSNKENTNE